MSTPLPHPCPGWVTVPNGITVVRLVASVPLALLILDGHHPVLTAVALIVFAGTDWIDGLLARRLGQVSAVGAVLDPVADRIGVVVVLAAFVGAGRLPWWLVAAIAAVDVVVGLAHLRRRTRAATRVSVLGKLRTAVLLTGLVLVGLAGADGRSVLGPVGVAVCGIGGALHLAAGIDYLRSMFPITSSESGAGR